MPNDVTWQSTGPLPHCCFGWPVLSVTSHLLCSLFMLQFSPFDRAPFSRSGFSLFFLSPLLKRHREWIGINSCCLDGLPMQFFKTHFTDTTGAIKDPQRNISIEECLYFALIVHLLWQTSKSRISALSNAIYCGRRCFDETWWISMPLLHREKTGEKWYRAGATKRHNQVSKEEVDLPGG